MPAIPLQILAGGFAKLLLLYYVLSLIMLKNSFPYFKKAFLETRLFSAFVTVLEFGAFGAPQFVDSYRIVIVLLILFLWFAFLSIKAVILASRDILSPTIIKSFNNKSCEKIYDILFITEAPNCFSLYEIGTQISFVYKEDCVERIVGQGVVINIQKDGKMQLGLKLDENQKEFEQRVRECPKNVSFKPLRSGVIL